MQIKDSASDQIQASDQIDMDLLEVPLIKALVNLFFSLSLKTKEVVVREFEAIIYFWEIQSEFEAEMLLSIFEWYTEILSETQFIKFLEIKYYLFSTIRQLRVVLREEDETPMDIDG